MLTAGWVRLSARAAREEGLWRAIACSVRRCVTCKSIGKIYVMVRIKTIDYPDGDGRGSIGLMDSNLYVLEKLAATMADRNPRHGPSPRPAGARPAAAYVRTPADRRDADRPRRVVSRR